MSAIRWIDISSSPGNGTGHQKRVTRCDPSFWDKGLYQLARVPEMDDGSRIIILYFRWINEARVRLLPFGSEEEVLEPYVLRASIADVAEQVARL